MESQGNQFVFSLILALVYYSGRLATRKKPPVATVKVSSRATSDAAADPKFD